MTDNRQIKVSKKLHVMPSHSPIDHVFRYYEPEQSNFEVTLPQVMQMNHPGLKVVHSHATMKTDILRDTCLI